MLQARDSGRWPNYDKQYNCHINDGLRPPASKSEKKMVTPYFWQNMDASSDQETDQEYDADIDITASTWQHFQRCASPETYVMPGPSGKMSMSDVGEKDHMVTDDILPKLLEQTHMHQPRIHRKWMDNPNNMKHVNEHIRFILKEEQRVFDFLKELQPSEMPNMLSKYTKLCKAKKKRVLFLISMQVM